MKISLVSVELFVRSVRGDAQYRTRFGPGMNVINAPNSWGKSTLLQSIVYALGLEGALSASRRSPLGPAMTQLIETRLGRSPVIESSVTLTIVNEAGVFLRSRRWGKSEDFKLNLVQVWSADKESALDSAKRQDLFVRDPGSTFSHVGFHRVLEEFIGWTLPAVPNHNNGETKLYLEVLFPLFYVEQKFGWSGVAPRVPTHYGIRNPLRRAVEYVLGLSTLDILRRREALRAEEALIGSRWRETVARIHGATVAEGLRLAHVDNGPVGTSQRQRTQPEASEGNGFVALEAAEILWNEQLASLGHNVVAAGDRTVQTRAELADAEQDAHKLGAQLRNVQEQLDLARADEAALAARQERIESDKRRLQDVQRIRRFGGELELPLLAEGRCPTCEQSVDARDVATGTVSSVEDNLALLDAERVTLAGLKAAGQDRQADLKSRLVSAQTALSAARDRIRLLRDELVGPSSTPSMAEAQARFVLEARLRAAARAEAVVGSADEELDQLATDLDDVRARKAELDRSHEDADDQHQLRAFRSSFQEQLAAYGLRSLSASDITIDERTLLPVSDGFELSFDVAMGFSASDTIRTKWAYHTALLETSVGYSPGHHVGLLVLDEPRQQETNRTSLAAFLNRLAATSTTAQILYATSEDPDILEDLLSHIPHTAIHTQGPHLIDLPLQ